MRQTKPLSKNNLTVANLSLDNSSMLAGGRGARHEFNLELPENSEKKPIASSVLI